MAEKILILSVSAGHGHVRAAEALCEAAQIWHPEIEAKSVDMMDLVPALFRKTYKDSYLKLVKSHPALWGYIYEKSDRVRADAALSGLRRSIESASSRALLGVLSDFRPDGVICTHFMPLQVLARWKRKGRVDFPLWAVVTDFVAHAFWLEPGQQGYFTAFDENVFRMRERGLKTEPLFDLGIPVSPAFTPAEDPLRSRAEAAARFGLDPNRKIFLLMGGGAGLGDMEGLARALMEIGDFQLVALAGQNKRLLETMSQLAKSWPDRLFPMGFSNEIPALLSASDLVITKPGGLTTVECLAMGKPMLLYSPIPGQEAMNADILLEGGAALKAPDQSGLIWRIRQLLDDPEKLARLASCAKAMGKPFAARDILSAILGRQAALED